MTIQTPPPSAIEPPAQPRTLAEVGLSSVMMRDLLLKTMFRMNLDQVSALSRVLCLPIPLVQELVDLARQQRLMEATGTLHANSGGEMGFQLTDAGKARALDALSQSEYYAALPVPLAAYTAQVQRQSVRNMKITHEALMRGMGHLILPPDLIGNLGPAVGSGRSILMYGPPGNGKSSIPNGIHAALGDKIYIPRAIEYSGQIITVYDQIVHSEAMESFDDPARAMCSTTDLRSSPGGGSFPSTCSTSNTIPSPGPAKPRCSSNPMAASSSSTTLVAKPNRRKSASTAGSCPWTRRRSSI